MVQFPLPTCLVISPFYYKFPFIFNYKCIESEPETLIITSRHWMREAQRLATANDENDTTVKVVMVSALVVVVVRVLMVMVVQSTELQPRL